MPALHSRRNPRISFVLFLTVAGSSSELLMPSERPKTQTSYSPAYLRSETRSGAPAIGPAYRMNRPDRLIRRKNAGLDRQALRRDDLDDLATMTERMRE